MYIYLLREKNWKFGNNVAKSRNAFNSPGAVPNFAKPKLRTTRAPQCETMLALDSRYRARDQLRRRGWNEDGYSEISRFTVSNFTVHRSQKSSVAFRATFSFHERVSRHATYNAKRNCGA